MMMMMMIITITTIYVPARHSINIFVGHPATDDLLTDSFMLAPLLFNFFYYLLPFLLSYSNLVDFVEDFIMPNMCS